MMTTKKDVVRQLEQIAIYMELKGENSFKISAFRKAAQALETNEHTLEEIEDYTALPGIGKGTAGVIEEFIATGESSVLKELKEEVPKGLIPLLQLPGLGGKKIAKLYKELGIENAEDLKLACQNKKVQALSGFGKKTEDKILEALDSFGSRPDRLPLAYMLRVAFSIESELEKMAEIERFSRAGSIRRMRETIKDLDFIIATNSPSEVKDSLLALNGIKEVIGAGKTKVSIVLELEFDVSIDFRLVKPEEFATTLHHFTGSKDHNVRMRQLAKERGKKISEYGVEDTETGEVETFSTEAEFYNYFGLPFIPPEMREDGKEVEDYKEDLQIVSLEDIKGDLHMHTTWSDGAFSIEEMIEANRQRGYKYMAITDHSFYLKVANGLSPERLKEQLDKIKALNEKYDDITILAGVEMDILPDGSLDYDDELLEQMDIVIASIHSAFSQPKKKIMERLGTALRNKNVDIIAHPTGRKIGKRDGYEVDMEDLIKLAKETNTVLELNSNPNRLDLNAEYVKMAQDEGVHLVINTDAHHTKELAYMGIGVSTAKKGWIKRDTVINTWETDKLLDFLKNRHQ
ncbi:DNA polymerase/3'-5' exonuclease PolX [Niallia taxi]|uniref:DNA polymerase beta n=1 Tax=Niallia taxi TaxID=2499688 RepID=A0A437KFH4_9BACI|nr:DNA polymerase/3'-5' exonuclease PolX [Niallia taxi]MCM3215128.1 DNA polymerase/3'-5' exonuclease PolX [Niallia taxi]RVT65683.1 DNA polymerase/3'-5' exonuclease PolX [Niallia taxi]